MIIEKRGYRKEYDENGVLISKTKIVEDFSSELEFEEVLDEVVEFRD